MNVVTQNVRVELTAEESSALRCANGIIHKFLNTLENVNCDTAYFEDAGLERTREDFEYVARLLDALGNEDPIIS